MARGATTVVTAAILCRPDGRLFLTRRGPDEPYGGYWEFPGGKVEWGEHPEAALRRELHEELGLEIQRAVLYDLISYVREGTHWIVLFYFVPVRDLPATGRPGRWVGTGELTTIGIMPPDLPVARRLAREGRDPASRFGRLWAASFPDAGPGAPHRDRTAGGS